MSRNTLGMDQPIPVSGSQSDRGENLPLLDQIIGQQFPGDFFDGRLF